MFPTNNEERKWAKIPLYFKQAEGALHLNLLTLE